MSELLLKSIIDKLEALENTVKELKKNLNVVTDYPREFEKKLSEVKINPPAVDLTAVNERIDQGVSKIKMVVEAQPKIIKRDFNFHLFPQINIREYYFTYSKLALFLILLILAAMLFRIGWKWIDGYNRRQNDLEQIESFKRYEENEIEIELKRSKLKISPSFQNPGLQKQRISNEKIIQSKRNMMDSFKTTTDKKIAPYLKDSLHK